MPSQPKTKVAPWAREAVPARDYPHTVDEKGRTVYPITGIGKPRMTRNSMYVNGKLRPAVAKYADFKREVELYKIDIPECNFHVIFLMPMPKSWSKKKRREMLHQPHQSKPDKDNLEKALLDSVFEEDSAVWDGRVSKIWAEKGAIVVGSCEPFEF